ncbi:MAG: hypothetical protein ACLFRA_07605, partial [Alphaproteobacteria bacterium]
MASNNSSDVTLSDIANLDLFESSDLTLLGWGKGSTSPIGDSSGAYSSNGFDAVDGQDGVYAVPGHVYHDGIALVYFDFSQLATHSSDSVLKHTYLDGYKRAEGIGDERNRVGDFIVEAQDDGTYDVLVSTYQRYNAGGESYSPLDSYEDFWGSQSAINGIADTYESNMQLGGNLTGLEHSPEVVEYTGFDHSGNTARASIVTSVGMLSGANYLFNMDDATDGDRVTETDVLFRYTSQHEISPYADKDTVNLGNGNSYYFSDAPTNAKDGSSFAFSIGGSLVFVRTAASAQTGGYGHPGLGNDYSTSDGGKGDIAVNQVWNTKTGELHQAGPVKEGTTFNDPDLQIIEDTFVEVLSYSWAEILDPNNTDPKPYSVTRHLLTEDGRGDYITGATLTQQDNGDHILALQVKAVYGQANQYVFYKLDMDANGSGNQIMDADGNFVDIDPSREWIDAFPRLENLNEIDVLGADISYLDFLNGAEIVGTGYDPLSSTTPPEPQDPTPVPAEPREPPVAEEPAPEPEPEP